MLVCENPEKREEVEEWFGLFDLPYSEEWREREVFFEHGQWYGRAYPDCDDVEEVTFSVVDTSNGIDFEELG